MSKGRSRYVCQACGAVAGKWSGRCDSCGAWNQIVEEQVVEARAGGLTAGRPIASEPLGAASETFRRLVSGIGEFDLVVGGGLVPGSAVLLGGEPGIGKSTLSLQVAAAMARQGLPTLYVTGEEALDQIRGRAQRLGLADAPLRLAAATDAAAIAATLSATDAPAVVVIDSIQTLFLTELESAPGSVAQVRGTAQVLIAAAKRRGTALVMLGHVTKEGVIAGPRVLEHMVDAVVYFEGDRGTAFRILRAVKNRFGAADEIGVFAMTASGLSEVTNPSALFLSDHTAETSGSAVFAGIEGTRPLLAEIQALVAPSSLATPRRAVVGWDSARLAMVLAVLDARCGLAMGGRDIYLNVSGGLRIQEPGADLAVAAALVSSLTGVPVPERTVVFGEIGLSGDVRPASQPGVRLREAAKLGFGRAWAPALRGADAGAPIAHTEVSSVAQLVELVGGSAEPRATRTPWERKVRQ